MTLDPRPCRDPAPTLSAKRPSQCIALSFRVAHGSPQLDKSCSCARLAWTHRRSLSPRCMEAAVSCAEEEDLYSAPDTAVRYRPLRKGDREELQARAADGSAFQSPRQARVCTQQHFSRTRNTSCSRAGCPWASQALHEACFPIRYEPEFFDDACVSAGGASRPPVAPPTTIACPHARTHARRTRRRRGCLRRRWVHWDGRTLAAAVTARARGAGEGARAVA